MAEDDRLRSAELSSLASGEVPKRYARNIGTLGVEGQRRLLETGVLVAGLGGLGGFVLESLARLGVGRIAGVDRDVFDETNLNRQLLSDHKTLGLSKAEAARERILRVNPAVEFTAYSSPFQALGPEAFRGLSAVFDCLDDIPSRRELSARCADAGVVLIHGAIAGWCGQVAVCPPGKGILEDIYAAAKSPRGAEVEAGNLPMTAAVAANLMVAAAVPVLLGRPAEPRLQLFDLSDPSWSRA